MVEVDIFGRFSSNAALEVEQHDVLEVVYQRVEPKIRQAMDLIAGEEVRSFAEAAAIVGCHRTTISRTLEACGRDLQLVA